MNNKLNAVNHLLSDARGQYIPRDFADFYLKVDDCKFDNVKQCYVDDLSAPENEYYWDAWEMIVDRFTYKDDDGNIFTLHHDGDLWLICCELMTNEEKINFGFEDNAE